MLQRVDKEAPMIEFAWPYAFLLLPLPLILRYWLPPAAQQEAALHVPFFHQLTEPGSHTGHTGGKTKQGSLLIKILTILAWLLLVTATAKPLWVGDPVSLPTSGRDLMVAVDISGSMKREDLHLKGEPVTRLTVVKQVLGDFLRQRQGDRLGLILFGTQAYLQTPLTFDRNAVATLLNEAQIGFAGEKTAIGDAIGLATKHLRERPESNRVMILLTDGANTAGEIPPKKAIEIAQVEGIKIHTIGVGATEMEISSPFGGLFGRRTTNPSADLDEALLEQIATATGGQYFRARDTQELQQIYAVLDQVEPIEQEPEHFSPIRSLYYWPLAAFVLLSVAVAGLKYLPSWRHRLTTADNGESAGA